MLVFIAVSAQARPPTKRRITKVCCDRWCLRSARVWVHITQVRMVLRWARPPRREANHEGLLRSGVPRGDLTSPKSGWCCAGPGLLQPAEK